MKIKLSDFRVPHGGSVKLKKWPTEVKQVYKSKEDYEKMLNSKTERLGELQSMLYAHDRYSLLLIFQAMDAAGKDGAIKNVMSGINPQGCQVFGFKQPSSKELEHDFLWRTTKCLPERGRIGIFNRSYYEEVLIVRVHPELLQNQKLPDEIVNDKKIWQRRYRAITDLENHLHYNGTRVVKFFLHLSQDEQRKRFLARIDEPDKNWKFSMADIEERKHWDDYMKVYQACINATSTENSPWYIIPADDKQNARLIISAVLVDTLKSLKMHYPEPSNEQKEQLKQCRRLLEE